jgi:hypothetical protein
LRYDTNLHVGVRRRTARINLAGVNLMSSIVSQAATLLRDAIDHALPISVLHERLCRDYAFDGSMTGLLATVQRRPDRFAIVQPSAPLAAEAGWDVHELGAYRAALDAVGLVGEVRVMLLMPATFAAADDGGPGNATPEPLQPIESAVLALWSERTEDAGLRADLSHALCEIERMRARLARRRNR